MKHRQLLCTFSSLNTYSFDVLKISELHGSNSSKIFIFKNDKNTDDVYITYSVEKETVPKKYPATINIHRKKETNTLYTLNGMNKLIEEENNGVFDSAFALDWKTYRNCLILTNDIGLRIIDIVLIKIL